MQYAIGPWVWRDEMWQRPEGAVGAIDLRPLPDKALAGTYGSRAASLFAFTDGSRIPSEYQLLNGTSLASSAWETLLGYRVTARDPWTMLWDHLLHGDPEGFDLAKPLMPTVGGSLELWMHGSVYREAFRLGRHAHTPTVRDMVQREITAVVEEHGEEHARRVLDYELDKYRLPKSQWEELTPPWLRSHFDGPLPHQTTITDDFNRADDATGLGTSSQGTWSWANVEDVLSIHSDTARPATTNTLGVCRAEINLSSADMYAQADATSYGTGSTSYNAAACRFSSSADTCYVARRSGTSSGTYSTLTRITGTFTVIGTSNSTPVPSTIRIEADGSTIRRYDGATLDDTTTDTSITGHLRSGIIIRSGGAINAFRMDNFEAGDLPAGTFTGTGALQASSQTVSGSATHSAPSVSATGALSASSQMIVSTATFTAPPPVFATGSLQSSSQTLSGTATSTASTVAATGALQSTAQTVSGTATFTSPAASATGALAVSSQTVSGDATSTTSAVTATGALSASPQSLSGDATFAGPGPAGVKIAVITIAAPSSTGNQTYTVPGLGEAPKGILAQHASRTAVGTSSEARLGFGMATGAASQLAFSCTSRDDVSTSQTRRRQAVDKCVVMVAPSAAVILEAELVSFGTSGSDGTITLNWTTLATALAGALVDITVFAGDDIDCNILPLQVPSGTGVTTSSHNHSLSGVPTFICSACGTFPGTSTANAAISYLNIGYWADGTQHSITQRSEHNVGTSVTRRAQRSGLIGEALIGDGTTGRSWAVQSVDATQVTIAHDRTTSVTTFYGLFVVSGVQAKVDALNSPTAPDVTGGTVASQSLTASGISAQAALFATWMRSASTDVETNAQMGLGMLSATVQASVGSQDRHDVGTMDASRFVSADAITITDVANTIVASAEGSVAGGLVSLEWEPFDTTSYEVVYVVLGSTASIADTVDLQATSQMLVGTATFVPPPGIPPVTGRVNFGMMVSDARADGTMSPFVRTKETMQ